MKKLNGLDKYVIFSIGVLLAYIITEMIVSTISGVLHDQLSVIVGASFGGEILSCALIKIFKLREKDKECDWREHGHDDDTSDFSIDSADL